MRVLDTCVLLYLVECQHLVFVEQEQNHSLVAVSDNGVILGGKNRLNFNIAVLVEPF